MGYLKKFLSLFFVALIITLPIAFFVIDWQALTPPPTMIVDDKEILSSKALILDLDGNGVDLSSVKTNGAVYWDIDQDDFQEASAWVAGNDGILAIDKNGDGIINHHGELFGNGFSDLHKYDQNSDKILDIRDQNFFDLLVWIDKNADGYSDKKEIQSLEDLDISSISLKETVSDYEIQENKITQESRFVLNGQSHVIASASLVYDNVNTIYVGKYELNPQVLSLPALRGYGDLPDLFIAMSKDKKLLEMVKEISDADLKTLLDPVFDLVGKVDRVMFLWAKVNEVDATSRGENIDAKKLAFLEKFLGDKYLQQGKYPNPKPHAASLLKKTYNKTAKGLLNNIFVQRAGRVFYEKNAKYNIHNGRMLNTDIDYVHILFPNQPEIISSNRGDAYIFTPHSLDVRINEKDGKDAIWLYGFKEENIKYKKEVNDLLIQLKEKTITIANHFMPTNTIDGTKNTYAVETLVFGNAKRVNLIDDIVYYEEESKYPDDYKKYDKLTSDNINDFYYKTGDVLTRGTKNILAFSDKHRHPEFESMTIIPIVDENGVIVDTIEKIKSKTQGMTIIKNSASVFDKISSVKSDVLSFKISEDGRSANVKNRTIISYDQETPINMTAECEDDIVLSSDGVIQAKKSKCWRVIPEQTDLELKTPDKATSETNEER